MRLWLIKLSRTTSAKSVRLNFRHSYTSTMASVMLLMLVIFIIVLSDIPLAPSIILLSILSKLAIDKEILPAPLRGDVEFTACSYKFANGAEHRIETVNFLGMAFVLLIQREGGQRTLIWRDSLSEASYRHLVVMLKGEH